MKKMTIFEPALCCETGVCGVSIDSELLRISTILNSLKKHNVIVDRFNLNVAPIKFINNKTINDYINVHGADGLPVVLIDDVISITGRYPTNEEFVSLLSIPSDLLYNCENINPNECNCADNVENTSCCGNDESC
ncbi:arsenite efflux transporter metallochaperone ArsD [Veillonella sp. YH-vei2232]|uniref:Arsenite efflux transporter metallochaperone ArsD n=1 Tax=Veillonella absiana TaxID=3079305 RepID=A0ABU3ZAQ1_9FIRM|nr:MULTISPECIES: arsenite efflux transporter metallochaperone ArsD [unclassified Veillonella]MDV5063619.1 arsenite efflux transporter metallochaperone ArsD [Veillonella sp. YH-vei2232]MDV5088984.1 arsenite efflux transporter metallochaperone ArsD [Veillonella sp. YH-vei2233]